MKKLLLMATVLVAAGVWTYTFAIAQQVAARHGAAVNSGNWIVSKKSAAARLAVCREDCRPDSYHPCDSWGCVGMHGFYRSYSRTDPELKSIEGRKQFAQCVKACIDPLPAVYIQRPLMSLGMHWFGKTRADCLECHAAAQAD